MPGQKRSDFNFIGISLLYSDYATSLTSADHQWLRQKPFDTLPSCIRLDVPVGEPVAEDLPQHSSVPTSIMVARELAFSFWTTPPPFVVEPYE